MVSRADRPVGSWKGFLTRAVMNWIVAMEDLMKHAAVSAAAGRVEGVLLRLLLGVDDLPFRPQRPILVGYLAQLA